MLPAPNLAHEHHLEHHNVHLHGHPRHPEHVVHPLPTEHAAVDVSDHHPEPPSQTLVPLPLIPSTLDGAKSYPVDTTVQIIDPFKSDISESSTINLPPLNSLTPNLYPTDSLSPSDTLSDNLIANLAPLDNLTLSLNPLNSLTPDPVPVAVPVVHGGDHPAPLPAVPHPIPEYSPGKPAPTPTKEKYPHYS